MNQLVQKANDTLIALLEQGDATTAEGLQAALLLIQKALPELETALTIVTGALDNASAVVDASEGEDYAYQAELELDRATAARFVNGDYTADEATSPAP